MDPFVVVNPQADPVPILLSIPHCGTEFPDELKNQYNSRLIEKPDDTDWYVHRLYDFAPKLGITVIHAVYSRWVIDLNRDPESTPLYTDGRIITGLCPVSNFLGEPLYTDKRQVVHQEEVKKRLDQYYHPYHTRLRELLQELKNRFGEVLLWDCHSIRQFVPTIHKEKFPDLILGDADGTSASPGLIEVAIKNLESDEYSFQHNYPFKGGYITRQYGRPSEHEHALQLEMSKVNYMNDAETNYHPERAEEMKKILTATLAALAEQLPRSV